MPQPSAVGCFRSSPGGEGAESIVEGETGTADIPGGGGIGGRWTCTGADVQFDNSDGDVEVAGVEGGNLVEVGEDLSSSQVGRSVFCFVSSASRRNGKRMVD